LTTHRNPESSGGENTDLVVTELRVLDVDEVGRPDRPIDAVEGADNTALGHDTRIGDVDRKEGVGIAPPQQAENVLGVDLDVGVSHHNLSLAGDQETVAQPCSGGLRAIKSTKSEKDERGIRGLVAKEVAGRGRT